MMRIALDFEQEPAGSCPRAIVIVFVPGGACCGVVTGLQPS